MLLQDVILILLIHFLADFGLQTHDQAINKSSSNKYLLMHVGVYTGVFLAFAFCTMNPWSALAFGLITGIFHFATDYTTSRISKPFFESKDFHNGFVVVGADQFLHVAQLLLTYKLLTNE